MTHGHEKSGLAVGAVKPANKAEPSAAEPGEPRAGAEGNAGQHSTRRAQDWASVSQALDRMRQAARQRKEEKFTALLHHISVDLLREAFHELEEKAAPGVDGLTWKTYESELERNLEDLHARVQRGAYRAQPSWRVYIPKPDGRQRPLAASGSFRSDAHSSESFRCNRPLQIRRGRGRNYRRCNCRCTFRWSRWR